VSSRSTDVTRPVSPLPQVRFDPKENDRLTSFSGLVIYQSLFRRLKFREKLKVCFEHLASERLYQPHVIVLGLIVQIVMGFRCLRDRDYYYDDPLVCGLLGVAKLPDVSTISRTLGELDDESVQNLSHLSRSLVLDRIIQERLARLTLDFDGSVLSTTRRAEGTAVGYNKKKKGARSYYPLFCTLAQTGQVLGFLHRSGNVHDSNGAKAFILSCVQQVRERLPGVIIEVRMDSAFFSDEIVTALNQQSVEFTISVPFERFVELKQMIELMDGRLDTDPDNPGLVRLRSKLQSQVDEFGSVFSPRWME